MQFQWQHYEILSQMTATSVQSDQGEGWSDINHVNVVCDTNQPSTASGREEKQFYDVPAS